MALVDKVFIGFFCLRDGDFWYSAHRVTPEREALWFLSPGKREEGLVDRVANY
jgi:hypothetical protein